jgi:2-keto-4-pentenoate hydratase
MTLVEEFADALYAAERNRTPIAPLRDHIANADDAYAVQEHNTRRALAAGRRLVGRKIGLTSAAVQRQLGVDRPDFGMLFADMEVGEGEPIAIGRILQPRIEAEVAFILDRDLPFEHATLADIVLATAYVAPALEIVGSRISDWNIRFVDTVADNASSGAWVLGGPVRKLDGIDLRGCSMVMERDGALVSEGSGAACLGNPLNAVRWLAREMVARGRPLQAGDIVLSGALGPMVAVTAGATYEARISGLGSALATFARE